MAPDEGQGIHLILPASMPERRGMGVKCGNTSPCRSISEPPRQEVLRVLFARQVQHPGHPGEDVKSRSLN
jgi:hypothetical protein